MAGCLLVKLFALHSTTCFRAILDVGKKEPTQGVPDQGLCYKNYVTLGLCCVSTLSVASSMDKTTIHVIKNGEAFTFGCGVADACCGGSDTLPQCNGKQHNQDSFGPASV